MLLSLKRSVGQLGTPLPKCRGFRKQAPKSIKYRYDRATASCISLSVKGLHAQKVRAVRERLKLSQEAMAELLGVTQRTVRRWEAGANNVSEEALVRYGELEKGVTYDVTGSVTYDVSKACPESDLSDSKDENSVRDPTIYKDNNKDTPLHVTRNDVTVNGKRLTQSILLIMRI